MEQFRGAIVLLTAFAAILLFLCSQRWLLDAMLEAFNNFRGGPPTPRHPLPANDGFLLRRRSYKKKL